MAGQMHLFEFVPASLADEQPADGRSIYRSAYMDIRLRQKQQHPSKLNKLLKGSSTLLPSQVDC